MESSTFIQKLVDQGWIKGDLAVLPKNKLNEGLEVFLAYKNVHMLRVYKDYFRLTLLGHNDERCFQIESENPDPIIDYLIKNKETLSMDTYLQHYMELQALGMVSILAIEQFTQWIKPPKFVDFSAVY